MDIEKINLCENAANVNNQCQNILRELERGEMNMRRVHSLLNKVKNKQHLYQYLVQQYSKKSSLTVKMNILQMFSQCLVDVADGKAQTDEVVRGIITRIYQIRHDIDNNPIQIDQILKILNNILKITLSLLKTQIKCLDDLSSKIVYRNSIQYLLQEEQRNVFHHLANNLFPIHLLTKIMELGRLSQALFKQINNQIIKYAAIFQQLPPITNRILQNCVVLAYAKIISYSTQSLGHLNKFITNLTFHGKLLLIAQVSVDSYWELIKDEKCQNEQQFEQLSIITEKYFLLSSEQCKEEICNFWLNNCFHILHSNSGIDIKEHLSDFPQDLLIQIYFKVSDLVDSSAVNASEKRYLLQMWKLIVMDSRMFVLMQQFKNMFINCELILFQLTREVAGMKPCSLQVEQIPIVLQIYSFYYTIFLKHKECQDLNHRLIMIILQQFPFLLREDMLLKENMVQQSQVQRNLIQERYKTDYLKQLSFHCGNKCTNIGFSLKQFTKEVGAIFIKYLIEQNIFPLNQMLILDDIVEYIIDNNIQIRLEEFSYIFEQKISKDVQKYIKLLSKRQDRSIYQGLINKYSINLLMNQLSSSLRSNVFQLSPIIIQDVIQHSLELFQLAMDCGISPNNFITSLYCLFIRSLYLNLSNLLYMMLLAINELKMQSCLDFLQIEVKVVEQLVKFCKMYTNNTKYLLVGYSSLLFLLYGSPFKSRDFFGYHFKVLEMISQNNYFIAKFIDLLSQQKLYSENSHHLAEENNYDHSLSVDLLDVIRKNLTFGLVCHIRYLIDIKIIKNVSEIHLLRKAFHDYIMIEASNNTFKTEGEQIIELTHMIRKRSFCIQNYEEEDLIMGTKQVKNKRDTMQEKREGGFITAILQKYKEYDQLKHYSYLEQQLESSPSFAQNYSKPLTLERVHGKIRNIIHIRK